MALAARAAAARGKTDLITPLTGAYLEVPKLNINGSPKSDLMDGYMGAIAGLEEAMTMLRHCMPHGRDYQTAPEGSYEKAREQHETRIAMLDKCWAEMEEIAQNVQGQGGR